MNVQECLVRFRKAETHEERVEAMRPWREFLDRMVDHAVRLGYTGPTDQIRMYWSKKLGVFPVVQAKINELLQGGE